MHICYIDNEHPPFRQGGMGVFTKTMAIGLAKIGHKITVIGFYEKEFVGDYYKDGVNLIFLPKSKLPKIGYFVNKKVLNNRLKHISNQEKIDIIEASNISLSLLSDSIKSKKVMRIHSEISTNRGGKFIRGLLIKKTISCSDKIIAVSEFSKQLNCLNLNLPNNIIDVIHNPIDIDLFKPIKNNINEESIIFVGKISQNKGALQLFRAIEIVVKKFPNVQLTVVGNDTFDKGKSYKIKALESISKEAKAAIKFLGPISNDKLPELISKYQICVYPSHQENMPIAWLEGMAMGKPIVCSDIPPAYEMIEDGVNGLLCNPKSPESIAEKINILLSDKLKRFEIGFNARETIERKFSIDKLLISNLKMYESLIESK